MHHFLKAIVAVSMLCASLASIDTSKLKSIQAVIQIPENNLNYQFSAPQICAPSTRTGTLVVQWNNALLEIIRDSKPGPPVVARTLALVNTAMYDAWAAYDDIAMGTRFLGRLRRPVIERTEENKRIAMSYAAYLMIGDLYPEPQYQCIRESILITQKLDPMALDTSLTSPIGIGHIAAQALIQYRHNDGSNQLAEIPYSDYTGYQSVNTPTSIVDPNRWQPLATPNGNLQGGCTPGNTLITQTHIAPHWGLVIPFALNDGSIITPTRGPALYPSPEYEIQTREIISISAGLTDRQKVIAEYWSDGPSSELPPGHWALIAAYVSNRDKHNLDQDVKMFFAMTNATFDAGILAWKIKRLYDYVRPITAIHYLFRGQPIQAWGGPFKGSQTILGEKWKPFMLTCFVTPAFSEFVSGHSTFSAAAAEVLESFTGSDIYGESIVIPAGWSPIEPNQTPSTPITLSWPTFKDAANEAGMSRRYGGIHFTDGDLIGRELGQQVGERAWNRANKYFSGTFTNTSDIFLPIIV